MWGCDPCVCDVCWLDCYCRFVATGGPTYGVLDHDMVFWLGDLNYRINLPLDETLALAKRGRPEDISLLLENDQVWDLTLRALAHVVVLGGLCLVGDCGMCFIWCSLPACTRCGRWVFVLISACARVWCVTAQLLTEKKDGRCFEGFEEGDVMFLPTYCYQPGTSLYEERPDKKVRVPAWCDRILWRSDAHAMNVKQLYYGRTEQVRACAWGRLWIQVLATGGNMSCRCRCRCRCRVAVAVAVAVLLLSCDMTPPTPTDVWHHRFDVQTMSDHKPVHALFELSTKVVLKARRQLVFDDLMRRVGDTDNTDSLPRISLSNPVVAFGNAYYKSTKTETITITNIGDVGHDADCCAVLLLYWVCVWCQHDVVSSLSRLSAVNVFWALLIVCGASMCGTQVNIVFRFVPKLEERSFCRPWLTVDPPFGFLLPGEHADVKFTLNVNVATARDLR